MCSAFEKNEQFSHMPPPASATLTGSHKDSPGGTFTPGTTKTRFAPESETRTSPAKGDALPFVTFTADASPAASSVAVTPAGHLPAAGFGIATSRREGKTVVQFFIRSALRRKAPTEGR